VKRERKEKKAREARMMKTGQVRVPEDCSTLQEAVKTVHGDDRLTTIVLGQGEHQIDGEYLSIPSAMNIVGDPEVVKEEIVVVGGIWFKKGIQGNCHVQHLTLRQAKGSGVYGYSSFTMEDVLVEQCDKCGVIASGTGVVGRCTNVEVRQCEGSGMVAHSGASITLIGAKTMVHHNCTARNSTNYGLAVWGSSSSTIQLIAPLTKETASTDNAGGGNWGASEGGDINQIKTIADTSSPASVVASDETKTTSTSSTKPSESNRVVRDKYVGAYKDGKMHGQGTKTWANGNKYVGAWKDDKMHGQGTHT
jgi:hypothetical protein